MASSPLHTPTHSLLLPLEHSESTSPRALMAKQQGSSSRNLAGMVEADNTPGRLLVGRSDPSAASNLPPRKRAGGPLATGVPCNPEVGHGLLAAAAEPAARRLRVAEAARGAAAGQISAAARLRAFRAARVRGIMSLNGDACCGGLCDTPYCACAGTHRRPPDAFEDAAAAGCRRCCRPLAAAIHMHQGMRFCTRRCRYDSFMEGLYEKREREYAAAAPASKRWRVIGGVPLVTQAEHEWFQKIFFG
ncbi:hypothetical protein ACP4OV_019072 [Aristida adscensionis]